MRELPEPAPLVSADHTLWAVEWSARQVCKSANGLCHALDRLSDMDDPDANAALNNAITALEFALTAATEKRLKKSRNIVDLKMYLTGVE